MLNFYICIKLLGTNNNRHIKQLTLMHACMYLIVQIVYRKLAVSHFIKDVPFGF